MFKRIPISYIKKFNDIGKSVISFETEYYRELCTCTSVEIEFNNWKLGSNSGAAMIFNVIKDMAAFTKENNEWKIRSFYFKKVHGLWIYANYIYNYATMIKPTGYQQAMIEAITSGDLRGDIAEKMVNLLYEDCIVMNSKSGFIDFFPEEYEKVSNIWKENNIKLQSE